MSPRKAASIRWPRPDAEPCPFVFFWSATVSAVSTRNGGSRARDDLSNLSEEGREQARALGRSLQDVSIQAIYSSPLQRAAATTASLLETQGGQTPDPVFDDGLLEVDLEPWSGQTIDELMQGSTEAYKIWKQRPMELELQRRDGSSYKPLPELMEQARGFISTLLERHPATGNDTVLVVAHNAILLSLIHI